MSKIAIGNSESLELNSEGLIIYKTKDRLGKYGGKIIPYKSIDKIIVKGNNFIGNGTLFIKLKHGYGSDLKVQFSKDYKLFCEIANKVNLRNKTRKVVKTAAVGAIAKQVVDSSKDNQNVQYKCSSFILDETTKTATPINGLLTITFQNIIFEGNNYCKSYSLTEVTGLQAISITGVDLVFENDHLVISEINNSNQLISIISKRYTLLTKTQLPVSYLDNFKDFTNKKHSQTKNNRYKSNTPAYKKAWFTWIFLLIFPPFGVASLWAFSDFAQKTKIILTVIFVMYFFAAFI